MATMEDTTASGATRKAPPVPVAIKEAPAVSETTTKGLSVLRMAMEVPFAPEAVVGTKTPAPKAAIVATTPAPTTDFDDEWIAVLPHDLALSGSLPPPGPTGPGPPPVGALVLQSLIWRGGFCHEWT